jgi:hypothetical protein
MTSFAVSPSMVVPDLRARVFVGGRMRSDVYCTGVSLSHGTGGSTASFVLPAIDWDGPKGGLRGRRVRVELGYDDGGGETVFVGMLTSLTGAAASGMVEAQAVSLMGLADTVYVGSAARDFVVRYPQRAWVGGVYQVTGWDVVGILQDILGSAQESWRGGGGSIESAWRAQLRLGPTTALRSVYAQIPLGDVEFAQETLRGALDRLLGMVGTVSFRERFAGDLTYLDFFELANPGAPARDLRVARRGEAAVGSNVLDVSHEETADDVRTRIIAIGDRRKLTVSVTTAHATAALRKGWDPALEASVLANPELSKGQKGAAPNEALQRVFRRFLLPECFRGLVIEEGLAVDTADGTRLPIQVWKLPRIPAWNATTEAWASALATAPVVLQGAELDLANLEIVLREPAVNLVSSSDVGGVQVDVYAAALVGVTLSVAGPRLQHDTGVRQGPFAFDGLSQAGLAEVVLNESFGFKQLGNTGFPFRDSAGTNHTFDATWIFVGDAWNLYDGAVVLQDDGRALRRFADGALREKSSPRHVYSVTTPYLTTAYWLGDRVRLIGEDGSSFGAHQVLSLQHTIGHDHSTTISTDSVVPMIANEVLGS